MLEMEHYRADNDRLVSLLKETKDYGAFAEFAMDNNGGPRYLGSQLDEPASKTKKGRKGKENKKEEDNSWIPNQAFKIAHDYREKHGNEMNETLINKMLTELNKVWRERERKQVTRIRNKCNQEIANLRRQVAMTAPVKENNSKRQISRLKEQLKVAQKELRETVAKKVQDSNRPRQADHVELALKAAGGIQDGKRALVEENQILKSRVKEYEKIHKDEDFERAKFMEGASWMAKKGLSETDSLFSRL